MSEWTPGPWEARQDRDAWRIDGPNDEGLVCEMPLGWSDVDDKRIGPDAHLIAAAPDLYEALEALERQCVALYRAATPGGNYGANTEGGDRNESAFADNDPAVIAARTILARARGEAQ